MSSRTDIANMAMSHLGQSQEIANVDTENSEAANACRRFLDLAIEKCLKDLPWPFATRFADLGLVEEEPTDEWGYSYRYPTDCLHVRRIMSGARNDSKQSRVPYKIVQDDSGLLIYTDLNDASIEYTVNEDNTAMFPSDFVLALSYLLAMYVAPRVTKGDPFSLKKYVAENYAYAISNAAKNLFNEESPDQPVEAEWIAGRE